MSYVPPHKRKDAPVKITGEFPSLAGAGAGSTVRAGPTYVSRIVLQNRGEVVEKEQKPVYEKTVESSFRTFKKEVPETKEYTPDKIYAGAASEDGWVTKESKLSKKTKQTESDWDGFEGY